VSAICSPDHADGLDPRAGRSDRGSETDERLGRALLTQTVAGIVKPWTTLAKEFCADGFYERFSAKGQFERVQKMLQRLLDPIVG